MKARRYTKETIADIGVYDRGFPEFNPGDCIEIGQRIKEGEKERVQLFEGDVIAIRKHGISSTFTVRRIDAGNIAVERVFPFYSPLIESIRFVRRGDVRRAKLFYMRSRIGSAARVKPLVETSKQKEVRRAASDLAKKNAAAHNS